MSNQYDITKEVIVRSGSHSHVISYAHHSFVQGFAPAIFVCVIYDIYQSSSEVGQNVMNYMLTQHDMLTLSFMFILFYLAIVSIFNKKIISVNREKINIRHKLIPVISKRNYDIYRIKKFVVGQKLSELLAHQVEIIYYDEKTDVLLNDVHSYELAEYIADTLNDFLGIK